jgi:hypothetical protein
MFQNKNPAWHLSFDYTHHDAMIEQFFDKPILNSPYAYPARHWELDPDGLPTNRIIERRRSADFITPIPKPKKRKQAGAQQLDLLFGSGFAEDSDGQRYNPTQFIQDVREQVDQWRRLPNPESWRVTPETARLLQHWRSHNFQFYFTYFTASEAFKSALRQELLATGLFQKSGEQTLLMRLDGLGNGRFSEIYNFILAKMDMVVNGGV